MVLTAGKPFTFNAGPFTSFEAPRPLIYVYDLENYNQVTEVFVHDAGAYKSSVGGNFSASGDYFFYSLSGTGDVNQKLNLNTQTVDEVIAIGGKTTRTQNNSLVIASGIDDRLFRINNPDGVINTSENNTLQLDNSVYDQISIHGISLQPHKLFTPLSETEVAKGNIGEKLYEIKDHLGNVRAVVTDRKLGVDNNNDGVVDQYQADVVSLTDYYPFGMEMPGRTYSGEEYSYGFNGKERDPEGMGGGGSTYDYGFRIYNQSLGRFFSVDPLTRKYPMLTPFQFASNRPIDGIDLDGLEYATYTVLVIDGIVTKIIVSKDYELKNENTKGPGIEYEYIYINTTTGETGFDSEFVKNSYGIYQGSNNPKLPKIGGSSKELYDDYSLEPIDEQDAAAKQHDLDYDKVMAAGPGDALFKSSTLAADNKLIKSSKEVIRKAEAGENDTVTDKPVTEEALKAAKTAKLVFEGIVGPIKKTVKTLEYIDNALEGHSL